MAFLRSRVTLITLALAVALASLAVIAITSLPASSHGNIVALDCNYPGVGGTLTSLRGIQFTVTQSFVSVDVRMDGNVPGTYAMTAELRRSSGFTEPILAAVRVSRSLPGTPLAHPYPTVHFDFPSIGVIFSSTFTLKFTDETGPPGSDVLLEFSGGFPPPCPNVMVTNENNVALPTEFGDPAGLKVLALRAVRWGDVDCSNAAPSAVDALKILRVVANLPVTQTPPCPTIGQFVRP